jgi:hypothetical protein
MKLPRDMGGEELAALRAKQPSAAIRMYLFLSFSDAS